MVTSHPKTPGQVRDPNRIGNDDFDNGRKVPKFGYPVLSLYKLKTPLKLEVMKAYGVSSQQGCVMRLMRYRWRRRRKYFKLVCMIVIMLFHSAGMRKGCSRHLFYCN